MLVNLLRKDQERLSLLASKIKRGECPFETYHIYTDKSSELVGSQGVECDFRLSVSLGSRGQVLILLCGVS